MLQHLEQRSFRSPGTAVAATLDDRESPGTHGPCCWLSAVCFCGSDDGPGAWSYRPGLPAASGASSPEPRRAPQLLESPVVPRPCLATGWACSTARSPLYHFGGCWMSDGPEGHTASDGGHRTRRFGRTLPKSNFLRRIPRCSCSRGTAGAFPALPDLPCLMPR